MPRPAGELVYVWETQPKKEHAQRTFFFLKVRIAIKTLGAARIGDDRIGLHEAVKITVIPPGIIPVQLVSM